MRVGEFCSFASKAHKLAEYTLHLVAFGSSHLTCKTINSALIGRLGY